MIIVLDSVIDALGLPGRQTIFCWSTMASKKQAIDAKRFQWLLIRGYKSLQIQLPVTFSREIVPPNRSHIPTPKMASQWPHLEHIASEIPPLLNYEIGLLIGYNRPRTLYQIEVIPPVGNGPYAQKTHIGWGIVGIVVLIMSTIVFATQCVLGIDSYAIGQASKLPRQFGT